MNTAIYVSWNELLRVDMFLLELGYHSSSMVDRCEVGAHIKQRTTYETSSITVVLPMTVLMCLHVCMQAYVHVNSDFRRKKS